MGNRIQSVERALELLETISNSERPLSVPEMAKKSGVNRATAWRLLNTLEYFDLIKKNEENNYYSISLGIWRIAQNTNLEILIRKSKPILEKIVKITGGSAFLEIASKNRFIILDECKPTNPIQVDLAGIEVPLYCGSVGKLFLSSFSDKELEKYLDQKFKSYTSFTITNKTLLLKEIQQARKSGVAYNFKEHDDQWCGITSVVLDKNKRHFAYLNLTLPTFITDKKELYSYKDLMIKSAMELEKQIN